ncbi:AMP-binding protein [Austwickia sp. TVS 96-490-7B]|uniref:AMP-binding protein n=1 Tax=Austwickia sp. TVS 96-490-7B TaxID=2830843 RepID=UPI001C580144|nr:AMP-binding protein [Austwickia sp. TVS 96-490-7B]
MNQRPVIAWPPATASAAEIVADIDVLTRAMDGTGPAIATAGIIDPTQTPTVPADAAVVIGTSGTTGPPKPALLPASALLAGREGACFDGTGAPGQWLLAVPPAHITGLCVMLRSLRAGYLPVPIQPGHFGPQSFVEATRRLDPSAPAHYTTLVPTQLRRVLDDPDAVAAARTYDQILVGAAPLPDVDRHRAEAMGIRIVEGYGLSETAGGCVYDGLPLPGTRLRVEDDDVTEDTGVGQGRSTGRIVIGGPRVALGYLGRPDADEDFWTDEEGVRWFRTSDHGYLDDDGRLHVVGRVDDVINTGGLKVAPTVVESAARAARIPGLLDLMVVGVPDDEWGQAITLVTVTADGHQVTLPQVRSLLADHLPGYALPRRVVNVPAIPLVGPAKPDRRAGLRLAMGHMVSL